MYGILLNGSCSEFSPESIGDHRSDQGTRKVEKGV